MSVATLGEAYRLGWRIKVRWAFGKRDGMKSIRECITRADLDMKTLVWTRGDQFPLRPPGKPPEMPRTVDRGAWS